MTKVMVSDFEVGDGAPLVLISGPCQIEGRDHALYHAEALKNATRAAGMNFVYKSSFDKANRTSLSAQRGVGLDEGVQILADVKAALGCPVLTDVHLPEHCAVTAEGVDILQIPAFLCRQTDLLVAAAQTGAVVNVKKGQFLAPWDMQHVADKLVQSGNSSVLLTERAHLLAIIRWSVT